MKRILSLLFAFSMTASATAGLWDAEGTNNLWSTPANWEGNVLPANTLDAVITYRHANFGAEPPLIQTGVSAQAGNVLLGDLGAVDWGGGAASLTMTGGSLNVDRPGTELGNFKLGRVDFLRHLTNLTPYTSAGANQAIFNISGGTVTVSGAIFVGEGSSAIVNQSGGSVTAREVLFNYFSRGVSNAVAQYNLNGGTLHLSNSGDFGFNFWNNGHVNFDIEAGTLTSAGNRRRDFESLVSNGILTAYNGLGSLAISYNFLLNRTTVTASPPSSSIVVPEPAVLGMITTIGCLVAIRRRCGAVRRAERSLHGCIVATCLGMAAWEPAPALAANFQLIRVVDGSTNPTPPDYITFRNVLFPNGVQTFPAISNPILQGHNIYGTDFIRVNQGAQPTWQCFYCGWQNAGQVNDRIYLRTSDDLEPAGPWTSPQVLVDNGVYEHACDPNVVVDENGRYHMLYTSFGNAAGGSARDWINYSTSLDGVNWTPNSGTVASEIALLDPNNISAGTIQQIARPALVKAGDTWKMWFDLKSNDNGVARQYSYLAESAGPTPTEFTLVHRYASHNNFPGFYEPDVQLRDDGTYIAVFQRHFSEIFMATSPDGINWQLEQNPIISKDHPLHPTNYISNPGFLYDQTTDTNFGVSFGMPTNSLLNDNDIGFAYSQYPIYVRSNGTVLHATAGSTVMTEQRVFTSGYSTFDTVVVTDPETGEILLQQSFSGAHRGDVWELQRVPAGDFDGDGDADGGDLLVWQRGLGTIYGPDDLEAWKSSFGMNASASTTVIPEPTALTIALGSVTLLAIRSRARFSW